MDPYTVFAGWLAGWLQLITGTTPFKSTSGTAHTHTQASLSVEQTWGQGTVAKEILSVSLALTAMEYRYGIQTQAERCRNYSTLIATTQ